MPLSCCAVKCYHTTKNCKLKAFPVDPAISKLWTTNINRESWERKYYHRLCQCHFDESQFNYNDTTGTKRLKADAIPLIFPTHLVISRDSEYSILKRDTVWESKSGSNKETSIKETYQDLIDKKEILAFEAKTGDLKNCCQKVVSEAKEELLKVDEEISTLRTELNTLRTIKCRLVDQYVLDHEGQMFWKAVTHHNLMHTICLIFSSIFDCFKTRSRILMTHAAKNEKERNN